MYSCPSFIPLNTSCKVVFFDQDTGLLAIHKPPALKSHPNDALSIDRLSIIQAPYDLENQHYTISDFKKVYLLNRIDAPTSGIVLLSTFYDTAEKIRKLFKERLIKKTYLAILIGKAPSSPHIWKDALKTENKDSKLRTSKDKSKKIAITEIRLIQYNPKLNLSLVELSPITGFTHQLRVQAALHNLPILNDKTYGDFSINKSIAKKTEIKRLCLHASTIQIEKLHIKDPMPEVFDILMN